jgi:hypothetical protein
MYISLYLSFSQKIYFLSIKLIGSPKDGYSLTNVAHLASVTVWTAGMAPGASDLPQEEVGFTGAGAAPAKDLSISEGVQMDIRFTLG